MYKTDNVPYFSDNSILALPFHGSGPNCHNDHYDDEAKMEIAINSSL